MRRFDYDENEEYREDVDRFFEEDDGMIPEQYNMKDDEIQELQIDFVNRDLNYRILRSAIKMCEKTLFWKFRTHKTRLSMIADAYNKFRELEEGFYPIPEDNKE